MNESAPETDGRYDWLQAVAVAVCAVVGIGLLFPAVQGCGPISNHARARMDAGQIQTALRAYYVTFGNPPAGDHARIMAALRGGNPQKVVFFEAPGKSFNRAGELLDPWGQAFRIDASEPGRPWAYSFGKNGIDEGGAEGSDDVASWQE